VWSRAGPAVCTRRNCVHEHKADRESVTRGHADMLRQWMWRDFANITLGVWLLASPATLGYTERAMIWNDLASGALIVLLGLLTLSPGFDLARCGLCLVGIWRLFAPLRRTDAKGNRGGGPSDIVSASG
jgi:hypothetical protein